MSYSIKKHPLPELGLATDIPDGEADVLVGDALRRAAN
jgi:hypothetical protein